MDKGKVTTLHSPAPSGLFTTIMRSILQPVLAFVTIFACFNAASAADWRQVGKSEVQLGRGDGGQVVYLDIGSLKTDPSNGYVTANTLNDYYPPQATSHGLARSTIRVTRFDCKGERLSEQGIQGFEGQKGAGRKLWQSNRSAKETDAEMELAEPKSIGQVMLQAVCELHKRGRPTGK